MIRRAMSSLIDDLRADIEQYQRFGRWYRRLGFWVGATYRLGAWANAIPSPVARRAALAAASLLAAPVRFFKDVHLPVDARIGPGFVLLHPHAIFIPPGTEIGPNCQLFHDVTLGLGPVPGAPRLGRSVVVYTGARVLGGITVGDEAEVGANAVVIRDVPGGSVVAAPSARAIPRETVAVVASPEARAHAASVGAARRDPGSNGK